VPNFGIREINNFPGFFSPGGTFLHLYRVIQKEVYTSKNVFYKKILMLNPCSVYGWKGNLSQF
jgi:hypothetical protein